MEAIKNQPARPLRQRNASIDAELDELCLRGLRKAPEERPASAGEFAAALRRWLERHRESSSVKPAAQLIRRRLLVASLAAGSLAAIVGCFLLAAGRNAGGEQNPRVLDGLAIEGQALPLLRHRPVDVVPPAPPPATSWSFDSSKQQLEINSLGVHGVVLGATRIADFDLSVRIQKNVWSGECGVFFGGESRFDEEGAQEVIYQSVSWYGADTGMARVERKLIYFLPTNGVLEYSRSHSFAEVVVARPAAGGGVEMSVKVRDGRVTAVSWDGQSLDLDDDSIAHRLPSEAPAATGKIGLVNFLGVSSFSKAEFTYQRGR